MSTPTKRPDIPNELKGRLTALDSALNNVENIFEPLLNVSQIELNSKLSTMDKAKLDLVAAYSINSLFWMYLNVCGVNPKDHAIKQELERIRSYMNRVKEIQDKEKAPKLDVGASKRFVKSALWQAAKNPGKPEQMDTADSSQAQVQNEKKAESGGRRSGKRRGEQSEPKTLTSTKIRKAQSSRYMNMSTDEGGNK